MKDVFAIQDEISQAILDNLKIKLLGETKPIDSQQHTENIEAYNLYLKGTYCWQMLTPEGYKKGVEYYEQALQKGSRLCTCLCRIGSIILNRTIWGNVIPNEAYLIANEYVNKALKIDSTLAAAYAVRGVINILYYWNWKESDRTLNFLRVKS